MLEETRSGETNLASKDVQKRQTNAVTEDSVKNRKKPDSIVSNGSQPTVKALVGNRTGDRSLETSGKRSKGIEMSNSC